MASVATKDGKVPITARFTPDVQGDLKRYAFERDVTPNTAISLIVAEFLEKWKQSGNN